MNDIRVSERRQAAHRSSIEVGTVDLVMALCDKLGPKLVAVIVKRDLSTINRWRSAKSSPDEASLVPLRVAYQVFKMLEADDSDATIRAWFMGMNPQLDDESPAEALRDGRNRDVMAAARAFLAGG